MDTTLNLKKNNCEVFDVAVILAESDFLNEPFIEALPSGLSVATIFEEHRRLDVVCNRRGREIDYRASVDIHPFEGPSESPEIHFHVILRPTRAIRKKQEPPPFAEEIFQWLSKFVSNQAKVEIRELARFKLSTRTYRSAFSLPLTLSGATNPVDSDVFEGSEIVSVRVKMPPNKVGIRFAQQTVLGKSIQVELRRRSVDTSVQKLMTIEDDVPILREIALSTVKKRRKG